MADDLESRDIWQMDSEAHSRLPNIWISVNIYLSMGKVIPRFACIKQPTLQIKQTIHYSSHAVVGQFPTQLELQRGTFSIAAKMRELEKTEMQYPNSARRRKNGILTPL